MKKETQLGRRKMLTAGAAGLLGLAAFARPAAAAGKHPRLEAAIVHMEDAVAYLEAAPHTFGGHKKKALEDLRGGIAQLRVALKY